MWSEPFLKIWMTIVAYSEKCSNFLFPAFEYGQYFLSRGGGVRGSLINCTFLWKISSNGYNIDEPVLGDGIHNNVLMRFLWDFECQIWKNIYKNQQTFSFPIYYILENIKSTISSNQRFLTITGIVTARWPGNSFSISSTEMSPRYAKVPVQTGLYDGEDTSPRFSRKHLRTTDLIPSMPTRRSQTAEKPSWNVRWTSLRISSYETRRWDKCKRPVIPLANPCCKSALWNLIAPPLSDVSKTELSRQEL